MVLSNVVASETHENVKPMEENAEMPNRFLKILAFYVIAQAVIGVLAIEYAWSKTKRFREINEERDSKFPAFRRIDV